MKLLPAEEKSLSRRKKIAWIFSLVLQLNHFQIKENPQHIQRTFKADSALSLINQSALFCYSFTGVYSFQLSLIRLVDVKCVMRKFHAMKVWKFLISFWARCQMFLKNEEKEIAQKIHIFYFLLIESQWILNFNFSFEFYSES